MKKVALSVFAIMAVLSLALTACGAGQQEVDVTVAMREFEFEPASINVPAGSEVNLTLVNEGALEHEFVIIVQGVTVTPPVDEAQLDESGAIYWEHELEPGEEALLEFTAPEDPGEYQIVCAIAGHLEAGMEGTLIVQ